MRVLVYGNQGNLGIRFAEWLQGAGLEARLFMPRETSHDRSRPVWRSGQSVERLPVRAHTYRERFFHRYVAPRAVAEAARTHDVVLTSGKEIVPALGLDAPVVFNPVGADITKLPFTPAVHLFPQALLYRRRIHRVARITVVQENCRQAARRLGVGDRVVRFPNLVDVDRIRSLVDPSTLRELEAEYGDYRRVFLHLSRKNLDPAEPNYKGNEVFVEALRDFADTTGGSFRVIVGLHGHDVDEFMEELEAMDLRRHCDFVRHLPLPELYAYLSLDNAVHFDQFGEVTRHSTSGLTREALALGTPVVTGTDPDSEIFLEGHGPGCPILSAFTAEKVREAMEHLAALPESEFEALRSRCRSWAEEYVHWESRSNEVVAILREAAGTGA